MEESLSGAQLLTHIMQVWRDDVVPDGISLQLLDTETNAHGGEASVDVFGALSLGDTFAGFLRPEAKRPTTNMPCPTHYFVPCEALFMADENYRRCAAVCVDHRALRTR